MRRSRAVGLRPIDRERVLHEDDGVVHVGRAEIAKTVVGEGAIRVGGEVGALDLVAQEELHELHQRHGLTHSNRVGQQT